MDMASDGQTSTQLPQSTQRSAFTTAFESPLIVIEDAGHSSTQVSHPVHTSTFTTAVIILITLLCLS